MSFLANFGSVFGQKADSVIIFSKFSNYCPTGCVSVRVGGVCVCACGRCVCVRVGGEGCVGGVCVWVWEVRVCVRGVCVCVRVGGEVWGKNNKFSFVFSKDEKNWLVKLK